jgi:pimeloyl-ACP methyl ester carboxylesterase
MNPPPDSTAGLDAAIEAFVDQSLRIRRPPADAAPAKTDSVPLWVDTPGAWPDGAQVAVHVRKRGRGPNALLVHGWQGRSADLEKIGDLLVAAGFTVWAPDLPGHGASGGERLSIPLAARVLRAVEGIAGPFALAVGHSIGGACVVQALEEGLWADRVVLLATPTHYGHFVRAAVRQANLPADAMDRVMLRLQQLIGVHPDRIDMHRQAAAMRQPALLIHSSDDQVVPFKGAQAVAATWPKAEWLLLEGLGHYRNLLESPQVLERVRHFANASEALRSAV